MLSRYAHGTRVDDYIATPKKSGYRAVHVMAAFHEHVDRPA
jgi:(p)ppGpp synthase/HD superfamily hydrolase